ncbi:MAG: DUF2271 domain-containing protein [Bacteroidales bacterium]|nr:DUF2271 domain-containing protein [Bacteroidales bacterium]MDD4822902.1 DUF2271 domain-containing protein [Bacteroidales bacterium]
MMKIFVLSSLCLLGVEYASAESADNTKQLTIQYNVTNFKARNGNQIAVWIEDESGKVVRSLYASRWTAKGGFKKDPVSLDEWAKKADWGNAKKEEVDAVSGATQKAGPVTLTWDGKDKNGESVANGKYLVRMQGNIKDDKMMFAQGEVTLGGKNQKVKAAITYQPKDARKVGVLFENVFIKYE